MSAAVPADRVGRYAVRRRIGSGGFATVWLGYDAQLDSSVAIKILADNWALDGQVRRRFVEEGRFLRRVDSPHVVSVHDAGELDDGRPYLVMTYADQGSLADRLVPGPAGAWPPGQALTVVRQVAEGLQALHDRDVLHRDVKPGNVLFKTSGTGVRAMLGDLGLGKALDLSSRLTVVAGTPLFVAPEQAAAESPDARADQYSLAALAFLLLTGEAPYRHASLQAAADPGPAPALPGSFPEAASAVLRRGLARDRDERWASVTALADALCEALPDVALEPVPAAPAGDRADGAGGPEGADGPDGEPVVGAGVSTVGWSAPSPAPSSAAGPAPVTVDVTPSTRPRRRRLLPWIAAAAVVAAVCGSAGWAVERRLPGDRTVDDVDGTLSVTVPEAWDRVVARDGWQPPSSTGDAGSYPALSVGTRTGWADGAGEGVFVALLPGVRLPTEVPQHPRCSDAGDPLPDHTAAGDEMVTVVFGGCPGVVVERVVRITDNRLLWVQVKADSRATASEVLDDVRTHGL